MQSLRACRDVRNSLTLLFCKEEKWGLDIYKLTKKCWLSKLESKFWNLILSLTIWSSFYYTISLKIAGVCKCSQKPAISGKFNNTKYWYQFSSDYRPLINRPSEYRHTSFNNTCNIFKRKQNLVLMWIIHPVGGIKRTFNVIARVLFPQGNLL